MVSTKLDWIPVILSLIIGFLAITLILEEPEYNNTDAGEKRSGLTLYTDNLTGCQYLEAGQIGGITPRVNGKGKHIGCR